MQFRGKSGDTFAGIAMVLAVAIPFGFCYAGHEAGPVFDLPASQLSLDQQALWFPLPECDGAYLEVTSGEITARGQLVETAYIRDQRIGRFKLNRDVGPGSEVRVKTFFNNPSGEMLVDTGPLSRMLSRALVGYGAPALRPLLATGPGTVGRVDNLAECVAVSPDILMVCGDEVFASQYVDSLALMWATRMGLNVAMINVAGISTTSPVLLRDFIKGLYDLRCAGHYGDGHLGFVVLLGDAYEDDNATRMVPDYDGYGGDYEASDHYYACLSGDDEFEDVMLGRIPVGNVSELAAYYQKVYSYSPLPTADWTKSVLLIGGCYFAYKDDYIDLFDQYESEISDKYSVSRFYRYDYPLTSAGDGLACQAVTDSLNKGFLFALYTGDGDIWDWGALNERCFRSSRIPNLTNSSHLPIVLSIACSNGWFDNRTSPYTDGGMDCFAERIVVAAGRGAVACVASSRTTGGGAMTIFTPEILKSAFVNGSSLLGELMLEAKTRHLLNLGSVAFVRQFNVFGDPCLDFVSNQLPTSAPDVAIRPYHVKMEPSFAIQGEALTIEGAIWNASGVSLALTDVGLYEGWPDSGGVLLDSRTFEDFYPWETRAFSFTVGGQATGNLTLCLEADASGTLAEADETNNLAAASTYVYPCESGFPLKMDDDVRGQVAADLDGDGELEILVTSGGSTAQAIDLDGNSLWVRHDLGLTQWFEGVEPAAADLNGDGTTECIIPIKAGMVVADGATGVNRWKVYTDYPCLSPVITDLEGDGSFEILLGTYSFTYSKILAYTSAGAMLWTHSIAGAGEKLTGIVVCDADLDGNKEVIYSTTSGRLTCLECDAVPPTGAWQVQLSTSAISSIVGGDLERDGSIEVVASHDSVMSVVDAVGGGLEDRFTVGAVQCSWNLSLADADRDGILEIICGSSCGELAMVDERAMTLHLYVDGTPFKSPVVADVDGDGAHEIAFSLSEGWLKVINLDGSDQIPPLPVRGSCAVTPIADNIDGDPDIELVVSSTDSTLFVLDMATDGGVVEWSYAGCSSYRTNLYAQPLFGELPNDLMLTGRVNVVGDVLVDSAATLTLERYTDMLFLDDAVSSFGSVPGRCELLVDGQLVVRGTQGGKARMRPADYPPDKNTWEGIIFRPGSHGSLTLAEFEGAVSAVEFQTADAVISECLIENSSTGIKVAGTSASPLIDSNTLASCDYGISASGGSPIIVNNVITSSLYNGIIISGGSTAIIEANRVAGTIQGNGIAVYSSTPAISRGNRFEGNSSSGIYLSSSSPVIDSCWVSGSGDCGIKAVYYSNPVISRTSLVGNKQGLGAYISSKPVLGDTAAGQGCLNDIRDNTSYAVYNRTPNAVKAQKNWWGTDEPGPSLFYGQTDYSGWLVDPPAGVGDGPRAEFIAALCPNPFSGSVRFSLEVSPDDLPVAVAIYDARGRLVRKITSREATGSISIEWDGRDSFGCRAASGAYFVSVMSRSRAETRKVVLLR